MSEEYKKKFDSVMAQINEWFAEKLQREGVVYPYEIKHKLYELAGNDDEIYDYTGFTDLRKHE